MGQSRNFEHNSINISQEEHPYQQIQKVYHTLDHSKVSPERYKPELISSGVIKGPPKIPEISKVDQMLTKISPRRKMVNLSGVLEKKDLPSAKTSMDRMYIH